MFLTNIYEAKRMLSYCIMDWLSSLPLPPQDLVWLKFVCFEAILHANVTKGR